MNTALPMCRIFCQCMNRTTIYSNDNEEKYNIKIDADSDEGVYTVDILYGVEICETQYVIDGEEKTNYNVTDYDSKDILTVTEKSFLFF